ncbi:MAG: hypothetical protein K9N51_07060 [Candidatus Pacebacteria bacterium]|nr:hypothetical protein [Candidatus Paceibacterota bacterium]
MEWLSEKKDVIEIDREGFEEWLGFPCDIEADEEILSVECFHVEALYGDDGEGDDFYRGTANVLREIAQVTDVTVNGWSYEIVFTKALKLI